MGKKLKIAEVGKEYTSIKNSPVGQMISHLKPMLDELIERQKELLEPQTVEKRYTARQIEELQSLSNSALNVLKLFDNGNVPGLISFGYEALGLLMRLYKPEILDTAPYSFYKILKKNLAAAVKTSKFKPDDVDGFKERLKAVLRKDMNKRYAKATAIPGCNLERYFEIIDEIIDNITIELPFDVNKLRKKLRKTINSNFFGYEGEFNWQELIISDPSIYNLCVESLVLLNQLPYNFKQIVPFLNPKAFEIDVRNSFLVKPFDLIPKKLNFLKATVTLTDSNRFAYTIIRDDKKLTYNLEEKVEKHLNRAKRDLLRSLRNYLKNYSETNHVKSELAKHSLLLQFVEKEKEILDKAERLHEDKEGFSQDLKEETKIALRVEQLDDAVDQLNQSITQLTDLLRRNEEYDHQAVATLIAPYRELTSQLQTDQAENRDITYSKEPLPDEIVNQTEFGELEIVPIKDAIKHNPTRCKEISELISSLQNQLEGFVEELNHEKQEWQIQEVEFHQGANKEFHQQLTELAQAGERCLNEFEDNFSALDIEKRIGAIVLQQNKIAEQLEMGRNNLAKAQYLQAEIAKAEWPPLLLKIMPETAECKCYQQSSDTAENSITRLQKVVATLEKRREALEAEWNKAKLAETMKSSDPSAIIELLESQKLSLQLKEEELKAQKAQKENKERQFEENKRLLQKSIDEKESAEEVFKKEKDKFSALRLEVIGKVKALAEQDNDVEAILGDAKLNSTEGLIQASIWLSEFLQAKQKQAEGLKTVDETNMLLAALNKAKTEFTPKENETGQIPFDLDNEINDIFGIKQQTFIDRFRVKKGFDLLLAKLNDNYHTPARWNEHRGKRADHKKVVYDIFLLIELLDDRIKICQTEKSLLDFTTNRNCLLFQSHLETLQINRQEIDRATTQCEMSKKEEKVLTEGIQEATKKIEIMSLEVENLTKRRGGLTAIAHLLTSNRDLNQQIAEIEDITQQCPNVDALNEKQEVLFKAIDSCRNKLQDLHQLLETVQANVTTFADNAEYQDSISKIQMLLRESEEKIEHSIASICRKKLKDLKEQIAKIEEEKNTTSAQIVPTQEEGMANRLDKLNGVLTPCNQVRQEIEQYLLKIEFLNNDLQRLTNKELHTEITKEINKFKELDETAKVLEQINAQLTGLYSDLQENNQTIAQLKFNESKENWQSIANQLSQVDSFLTSFPIAELNALKVSLEEKKHTQLAQKTTELLSTFEEGKKHCQTKMAVNSQLNKRIEARNKSVENFIAELTIYSAKYIKKYAYKNGLFAKETLERDAFIINLCEKLKNYAITGNSQEILNSLYDKKESQGLRLRSILNRIIINLNELDKQIPTNYEIEVIKINVTHDQASQKLEELNDIRPEFVTHIKSLYEEIEKLSIFSSSIEARYKEQATEAKKLSAALQQKVDQFILDNSELLKSKTPADKHAIFSAFYSDFICHVHSQDDVMSQHTSWAPFVANIVLAALAVFTIGLAIPVKRGATHFVTGRDAFFCRTDGIACVDSIGEAISNVGDQEMDRAEVSI